MPVLFWRVVFLNTTLPNSTGKPGLLYCTNDVIIALWGGRSFWIQQNNIMCILRCSINLSSSIKVKIVFVLLFWLPDAPKKTFDMCRKFPLHKIFADNYPYILDPGSNVLCCFVFSAWPQNYFQPTTPNTSKKFYALNQVTC